MIHINGGNSYLISKLKNFDVGLSCILACIYFTALPSRLITSSSEIPVKKRIICIIYEQYRANRKSSNISNNGSNSHGVLSRLAFLKQVSQLRDNRHTYCHSEKNKEDIIHKGAFGCNVDKCVAICAHEVAEELTKPCKVGKVENTEADYYYKLAVNVHYRRRYLL